MGKMTVEERDLPDVADRREVLNARERELKARVYDHVINIEILEAQAEQSEGVGPVLAAKRKELQNTRTALQRVRELRDALPEDDPEPTET